MDTEKTASSGDNVTTKSSITGTAQTEEAVFEKKNRRRLKGIQLPKTMGNNFNFFKWAGKIKDYVFKFITQQRSNCKVCGRDITMQYNNPRQMLLYCSQSCRWARHNKKYMFTKRGHK